MSTAIETDHEAELGRFLQSLHPPTLFEPGASHEDMAATLAALRALRTKAQRLEPSEAAAALPELRDELERIVSIHRSARQRQVDADWRRRQAENPGRWDDPDDEWIMS